MLIFACIVLFFAFLLSIKATLTLEYKSELTLFLRVLGIRIGILPKKEKKHPRSMSASRAKRLEARLKRKAEKKRKKREEKKAKRAAEKEAREGTDAKKEKRTYRDIVDTINLVCTVLSAVLKKLFGHLHIKASRIRIRIGSEDAAVTAVGYGAVSQALNVLLPLLRSVKGFSLSHNAVIDVAPDFTSDTCEIDLRISFSLRVWHLLSIAFAALKRLIVHYFRSLKKKDSE